MAPFEKIAAKCGNGLIDEGEDCDCSDFQDRYCSTNCCDQKTCKFKPGSECATGLCCNFSTCKVISAGDVCRAQKDVCDIEDKCDGQSNLCPDINRQDGSMCSVNISLKLMQPRNLQ
ncbi:hypothetical protein HELRODRAFT_79526 [Helobdella robusta]|uniref:Disintegrin domain-containing protein n=1 Tax=Helobdella robusta TaxID=6412 RepID=T1G3P7_HELRO|nr:hypothetical protein HELRODRAFT_79526 [Helobdella robusta]ESO03878.1 hypothetical protein HELRODRAFT_79526 [Helobdella robusta]